MNTLFSQDTQAFIPQWHYKFIDLIELPHWLYVSDEAHKLIAYFLWQADCQCYVQNIAELLSLPLRTTERMISRLKEYGILESHREYVSNGYKVRSYAEYSLREEGLHKLNTYLLGINFPDYPKKSPYRSILVNQSIWKIFNYFAGPPKSEKIGRPRKNPFGENPKILEEFMKTRFWEFLKKSNDFAGGPNFEKFIADNFFGFGGQNILYKIFSHSDTSFGSIFIQKNTLSGESDVQSKISGNGMIGESSESYPSQFRGMRRTIPPKESHIGNSRVSHEDSAGAHERRKTNMALGFIKNAPEKAASDKKRCIVKPQKEKKPLTNLSCERYIDYWNELAEDIPAMPRCMKTRAGKPTKGYKTALTFFAELQSGRLMRGSTNFPFSATYMSQFQLVIPKEGYSPDKMFHIIKQVSEYYAEESSYMPTSFAALLYTKFSKKAQESGSAQSVFLELASRSERTSLALERLADSLPAEDHRYMRDYFLPAWYKIRHLDLDHEIPEDDIFDLVAGLKTMKRLWKLTWKERCLNSRKVSEQIPRFDEFVSVFFESLQIDWNRVPISHIFNPKKQYLGWYLEFLEGQV